MSREPGRKPAAVSSLRVHVLVDGSVDLLSSAPEGVVPHVANLRAAPGPSGLSGEHLCCGAWGLSLGLEIGEGGRTTRILFDAGPDGATFRRNVARLRFDADAVDAIVLSHGHWDHAGGLLEAVEAARARPVPLHANPEMFVGRGVRTPAGAVLPFRDPPSPAALTEAGAALDLDGEARLVAGGVAHLSGLVPRETPYERGFPGHLRRDPASGDWIDDPWILDERWLGVHVLGAGIVLFSACSHAGIVNVVRHAARVFAPLPIHAVVGGFHLAGPAGDAILDRTIEDLAPFPIERIVPGHCTGWRATQRLAGAFPGVVTPSSVGQVHEFEGSGSGSAAA